MNEIYEINGVRKTFMDWCQEYGANSLQVRALMSLGQSLENALTAKRRRPILICMNGKTLQFSEWCRLHGITGETIRRRVGEGCTLQEAFEAPKHKHLAKTYRDDEVLSMTKPFLDWCRDYFIDPLHVRAAMSMGRSLEYALKTCPGGRINILPMQVGGYTDTFLRLCQKHKIAYNTVRRRVNGGLRLDDAFLLPPFRKGEMEAMLEAGRANEPHSIAQPLRGWAGDYNQPMPVVRLRLDQGMPLEQALSLVKTESLEIGERLLSLSELCAAGCGYSRCQKADAGGQNHFGGDIRNPGPAAAGQN